MSARGSWTVNTVTHRLGSPLSFTHHHDHHHHPGFQAPPPIGRSLHNPVGVFPWGKSALTNLLCGIDPTWQANNFFASHKTVDSKYLFSCSQYSTIYFMSQMNPVHAFLSVFLELHLNIILPSTPVFYRWCLLRNQSKILDDIVLSTYWSVLTGQRTTTL